jgi:hypothetical protein
MNPPNPNESLERYIDQAGVTTGPRKLAVLKLALRLRNTPGIRAQENAEDPMVHVKVFDPCGMWTWFVLEWDGASAAFGVSIGPEKELGYVDLVELSEVPGALGIGLEVDVWFKPQPLSRALEGLARGQ